MNKKVISNLKICHVTLGRVNPKSNNGINGVIGSISRELNTNYNINSYALTLRAKNKKQEEKFNLPGLKINAYRNIKGLIKALWKSNHDVYFVHNAWSLYLAISIIVLKIRKKEIFFVPHASLMKDRMSQKAIRKGIYHYLFQRLALHKTNTYFVSAYEKEQSLCNYKTNRVIVINNSATCNYCSSRSVPKEITKPKFTISSLSRISEEKNIIDIVKLSKNLGSKYEINIYGPRTGKYYEKCRNLAQIIGAKSVTFKGAVYEKNKCDALRETDVFLMVSSSEASPVAAYEALLHGCTVVTNSSSGLCHLQNLPFVEITDGDLASVEEALEHVRRRISEGAYTRNDVKNYFRNNLSWHQQADKLLKEITTVKKNDKSQYNNN